LTRATARPWTVIATLLCLSWGTQPAFALPSLADLADRVPDLPTRASECEANKQWLQACIYYDELLRKAVVSTERENYRNAYLRCLRHYHQSRRHDDEALRQSVSKMTAAEAYEFYDKVLYTIESKYFERIEVPALFQQGLKELQAALDIRPSARSGSGPRRKASGGCKTA